MDYRQTEGSATSWRRSNHIMISNAIGQQPFITFQEEDVVMLGDRTFAVPGLPKAVHGLFDPAAEIPLLNPLTEEPLGTTATHQDLYVILHSLYMQLAKQRDEAEATPAPMESA